MSQNGFFKQYDENPRNLTIDKLLEDMMKMDDDVLFTVHWTFCSLQSTQI